MLGSDPQFIEATRLASKFFPESKGFISAITGLDWGSFLGAMMAAEYRADYSCDPFREATDPDLGFAGEGGLEGSDQDVFARLLQHTGLSPSGRAIVIPDAIGSSGFSTEDCYPFVCAARSLPDRLKDFPCFQQCRNVLFIFECGTAIMVDHDDRIHWARSRIRSTAGGQ